MLAMITIILSSMIDKCCRHSRRPSHVYVKCMKYRDNKQLKRSLIKETNKYIHGNDSILCAKCSIQKETNKCIHGNDSKLFAKCSIQNRDQILCINGWRHNTCGNCIRKTNEKMNRKVTKSSSNIKSSRKVTNRIVLWIIAIISVNILSQ